MKRAFNLFLLLLSLNTFLSVEAAFAQSGKTITGKVTSSEGEALPGVSVLEVGTVNATVTDLDGKYSLKISGAASRLEFSYIGFIKQQAATGALTVIDVVLQSDVKALSEAVVIGYGVEQKALLTGSVGIIKAESLKDIPVSTVDGIMQG